MRNTVIAIALSLACTQVMAAKLYKWVDENGVTQFSQQPPASQQYERMNVSAPPQLGSTPTPAHTPPETQAGTSSESGSTAAQQAEREQKELREAQCAKLREDLNTLENNPRLGRTNADGQMERIGEDERQAMMTRAREELASYCD